MSAAHTPGPWQAQPVQLADFRTPTGNDLMIVSPDATCAAIVWEYGAEGIANAHLIAAAPDLLDLARQYASECGACAGVGITVDDKDCLYCGFIRDVITKAVTP